MNTALIGIDWGTTRLRGYRISDQGEVLQQRDSSRGISSIQNRDFATALTRLISDWLASSPTIQILLCGMIGSRQGWHEAPYSTCPANLAQIANTAVAIAVLGRKAYIVGGISTTDDRGRHDVMRGEETQILGVTAPSGGRLIIAPGTHSKWAVVQDGTIQSFRTYMTGEMYAVLKHHSTLGWCTKGGEEGAEHDDSFLQGLHQVLEDPDLLHTLFTVRTRALFEQHAPAANAAYLSGILIGSEVQNGLRLLRSQAPVTLIAPSKLARLYQRAFAAAGINDVEQVEADQAVTRGLWKIWQMRNHS